MYSLPKQITIDRSPAILRITFKWRSLETIVYALISLALFITAIIFIDAKFISTSLGMIKSIIIVSIAFALSYYTMAFTLNKTIITAQDNMIEVKTSPILWFGTNYIKVSYILGISSKREHKRKDGYLHSLYQVHVIRNNGAKLLLFGQLKTLKQAQFIHLEIEQFLRIDP